MDRQGGPYAPKLSLRGYNEKSYLWLANNDPTKNIIAKQASISEFETLLVYIFPQMFVDLLDITLGSDDFLATIGQNTEVSLYSRYTF